MIYETIRRKRFMHWILISRSIAGDIGFGYSDALGAERANKEKWLLDTFFNAGIFIQNNGCAIFV